MPKYNEFTWANRRGHKLFAVEYLPENGAPNAILVHHHGYGEHTGRYKYVFGCLADNGLAVFAYDASGHGKSEPSQEKDRFIIRSVDDLVDDLLGFTTEVRSRCQAAVPVFLAGHSMGGLLAARAVLQEQHNIRGLILSSPALHVDLNLMLKVQAILSGILCAIIPGARIVDVIHPKFLNPQSELVEEYMNDPLIDNRKMHVSTGRQLLMALQALPAAEKSLRIPILAFHGDNDHVTSVQGTHRLMDNAGSTDKTKHIVAGAYHEMLMNPDLRDELIQLMTSWISDRIQPQQDAN